MNKAKRITELREKAGKNFRFIRVRTLEDWRRRRTTPEYIPLLLEYQLKYEKLVKKEKGKT